LTVKQPFSVFTSFANYIAFVFSLQQKNISEAMTEGNPLQPPLSAKRLTSQALDDFIATGAI
jgi:hypothetical protein